jgi:hypothetical protein
VLRNLAVEDRVAPPGKAATQGGWETVADPADPWTVIPAQKVRVKAKGTGREKEKEKEKVMAKANPIPGIARAGKMGAKLIRATAGFSRERSQPGVLTTT